MNKPSTPLKPFEFALKSETQTLTVGMDPAQAREMRDALDTYLGDQFNRDPVAGSEMTEALRDAVSGAEVDSVAVFSDGTFCLKVGGRVFSARLTDDESTRDAFKDAERAAWADAADGYLGDK